MTDFHALDLSGDRAALHRWDGRDWHPVATAPAGDGQDARALADLLAPVAGRSVAVVLPLERIAAVDIDAGAAAAVPPGVRVDWLARGGGGWRRLTLPDAALQEIEDFLRALGVVPGGCLAAAGDEVPPAWFGTTDSAAPAGRALDRPGCLGPAGAAPAPETETGTETRTETETGSETRIAAARRRAAAAARRDPAHLVPLPDAPATADGGGRFAWRMQWRAVVRSRRPALAAVLLLAAVLGGLAALRGAGPVGPVDRTPDMATLAAGPADSAAVPGMASAPDRPTRAGAPVLARAPDAGAPLAPRPARQADLSAMDAPPGMLPEATFYTPPFRLAEAAAETAVTLLIPGLDPVFRTDALALAAAEAPPPGPDARRTLTAPPPRDEVYVVDARGLIRPSPEGRLSPDGFTVIAGTPPVATRPRPERTEAAPGSLQVMRRAELAADDPLRGLLPRARPDGLAEARERDRLGGRTATELAAFVPMRRPESAQERAGTAAAAPATVAAVAFGPRPARRNPDAIARARAAAQAPTGPAIAATDVARVTAPTPAAAADRATARVGIDLSQINLLGTFGASGDRRALVRLSSGRVVNLSVGDRVDGGRVQEIGDGRLGYVKSGRVVTLSMPRG